jgi:hypothetical protein
MQSKSSVSTWPSAASLAFAPHTCDSYNLIARCLLPSCWQAAWLAPDMRILPHTLVHSQKLPRGPHKCILDHSGGCAWLVGAATAVATHMQHCLHAHQLSLLILPPRLQAAMSAEPADPPPCCKELRLANLSKTRLLRSRTPLSAQRAEGPEGCVPCLMPSLSESLPLCDPFLNSARRCLPISKAVHCSSIRLVLKLRTPRQ